MFGIIDADAYEGQLAHKACQSALFSVRMRSSTWFFPIPRSLNADFQNQFQ